jgi:hypothetical protein
MMLQPLGQGRVRTIVSPPISPISLHSEHFASREPTLVSDHERMNPCTHSHILSCAYTYIRSHMLACASSQRHTHAQAQEHTGTFSHANSHKHAHVLTRICCIIPTHALIEMNFLAINFRMMDNLCVVLCYNECAHFQTLIVGNI